MSAMLPAISRSVDLIMKKSGSATKEMHTKKATVTFLFSKKGLRIINCLKTA